MANIEIYEPETVANALTKSLEAPQLDPIMLAIANEVLSGREIPDIADEYNVSSDLVTNILEKKAIKNYMDNVVMNQGFANRAKRIGLINTVINKMLKTALETDVYSKKDLLDWIKLLNQMDETIHGKNNKPSVAVQVNNNYQSLMEDLLRRND